MSWKTVPAAACEYQQCPPPPHQGPSLVRTPPKGTINSKLQAENFRVSLVFCPLLAQTPL